jgi:hypothetical protein
MFYLNINNDLKRTFVVTIRNSNKMGLTNKSNNAMLRKLFFEFPEKQSTSWLMFRQGLKTRLLNAIFYSFFSFF